MDANLIWRTMMQFKKYFNTILYNRLGGFKYIEQLGDYVVDKDLITKWKAAEKQGTYVTVAKMIRDTKTFAPLFNMIKGYSKIDGFTQWKWDKMTDQQRYGIVRTTMDMALFLIMYGLSLFAGMLSDDDDKKKAINSSRLLRSFRSGVMTTLAITPSEMQDLILGRKNFIPIIGTIKSMTDLVLLNSADGPLKDDIMNLTVSPNNVKTAQEILDIFKDEPSKK
jgi:hypothetical protein